jgi:hypothetical protein
MPGHLKDKYTKAKDEKKDAKMLKKAGFDKDEKAKFEKEDKKMDSKIIKKIKKSDKDDKKK